MATLTELTMMMNNSTDETPESPIERTKQHLKA